MKKLLLLLFIACFPAAGAAQIFVGGLADLELRKGQADSAPFINQTPGNNFSVYTPNIRLFGLGIISDRWFVEMALQADHYHGKELSPFFFSMINVNWMPVEDSGFTVTAGRFVTPYGLQSERLLSSENPFVHLPLSHAFNLNVDKKAGLFSGDVNYETGGRLGQSMVYQRGYAQGIKVMNNSASETWFYEFTATLASASSHLEYGMHNRPAFTGRLAWQPVIWARLGASFSTGPYMVPDPLNDSFSNSELSSFTQLLLGGDLTLSYTYFTFAAEFNFSRWKAPDYSYEGFLYTDPAAEAWHISAETVIRLPFLPGAYTAIRGEQLRPQKLAPGAHYSQEGYFRFGPDVNRAEFLFGYRINRNVTAKASWLAYSAKPSIRADVLALQLSVLF